MDKPKRAKQLVIEIPDELHKDIKLRALKRNIPMRVWVARAITKAIEEERKYE